ncbi:MAG: DUF1800 domain-containing protein [Candidatus Promineifilaceae bacterium]
MSLSRRQFLRLGAAATAATAASACSVIGREVKQNELPAKLIFAPQPAAQTDTLWRLLNRAGFGPRPGDYQRAVQMGAAAWLEQQLNPEQIDDTAVNLITRQLSHYPKEIDVLLAEENEEIPRELIAHTLMRALYSNRQLYEVMVEFWSDHFNIYLHKNQTMPYLKLVDDREVIRPYALTTFRQLLHASAKSPAMLVYLDNIRSTKEHPNENYARELLELHTLGVHAGYTQQDVQETARLLTGWHVRQRGRQQGRWFFNAEAHDYGEKTILGHTFPAGEGEAEVLRLLDMLASHPATATFIATKLVRRFVADDPPASLVNRLANTFLAADGDIKAMLHTLFLSDEFATAPPKLKRPFTYLISALRALNANVALRRQGRALGQWLRQLGQMPFMWPPPNGYPVESAVWATNLLPRWNFALALVHHQLPGITIPWDALAQAGKIESTEGAVNLLASLTHGPAPNPNTRELILAYVGTELTNSETRLRLRDAAALLLASPDFQWT